MELFRLTAHELHDKLTCREVSATEITRSVLDRTEKAEPKIRSFITRTAETALQQAAAVGLYWPPSHGA